MMHRAAKFVCLLSALLMGTGCYTYAPASGSPSAGTELAVVLTDRGRVALNARVGPEIDQLRGKLVSISDTSLTLSMSESVTLRGESSKWTDEVVTMSREHVSSMRTKAFSRGRTSVIAGTFGAAAAFFVINSAIGDDNRKIESDPSTPPVGPGPSSKVGTLSFPFRSDF
jgi:hypothetical protein